jgi:hypothetical protein
MSRLVRRVVAIGDLNGADRALETILRGTGLVDRRGRWAGRTTHLVQLGDVFNRGPGGRAAFLRLLVLARQATAAGGRVSVLLGNHEVMTALGNEAYCTVEEYLAFAPAAARRAWPARVQRATGRLYRDHGPRGPILPYRPRLEAWAVAHVPGRREMRRELGPRGRIGRALRRLPVAVRIGRVAFVHSVPALRWARLGVDGLDAAARDAWRAAARFWRDLPGNGMFRADDGPLWNRALVEGRGPAARAELRRVLEALEADRIVVGHTQTRHLRGQRGRIELLHGGRVVCADVSLGAEEGAPLAALDVREGGRRGYEWTPAKVRRLW